MPAKQFYSLKDAAEILRVQAYRIVYLLSTGQVQEPQRIGGKRIFAIEDLHRLSERLGLEKIEDMLDQQARADDV